MSTLSESKYSGRVLETSAHLNNGMDGGPLVDAHGALVGVLCLNYSRSRWLGTAAPIDDLKPFVLPELGVFSDVEERLGAFAGLWLADEEDAVKVRSVSESSPAREAGLAPGDIVIRVGEEAVTAAKSFRTAFLGAPPGTALRLRVSRDGAEREIELRPWGRL
jgi:S1-C subfamily serine protease